MNIPGSNLLSMALRVIRHTPVSIFKNAGSVTNEAGVDVTNYAAPVLIKVGSLQSVNRAQYSNLGLDFQKTYYTWYVPNLVVVNVARDNSGDVIEALGRRYQLIGSDDWTGIDNWLSVLAVDIGVATGALTNA